MIEIFANLHPLVLGLFLLLCITLACVIVWCVVKDNALVSKGYDEHARESHWGQP